MTGRTVPIGKDKDKYWFPMEELAIRLKLGDGRYSLALSKYQIWTSVRLLNSIMNTAIEKEPPKLPPRQLAGGTRGILHLAKAAGNWCMWYLIPAVYQNSNSSFISLYLLLKVVFFWTDLQVFSFSLKQCGCAQVLPDDGTFTVRSQATVVRATSKSLESAVTFQRQLVYLSLRSLGLFKADLTCPWCQVATFHPANPFLLSPAGDVRQCHPVPCCRPIPYGFQFSLHLLVEKKCLFQSSISNSSHSYNP